MKEYFVSIFLTEMAVLLMFVNIRSNLNINQKHRRYFRLTYGLIAVTAMCECIGRFISNSAIIELKPILIIVKFIEFSITPCIPVIYASIFKVGNQNENFAHKVMLALLLIHILTEVLSLYSGTIFLVNNSGVYERGTYYAVYVISFVFAGMYLFWMVISFSSFYQNKDLKLLVSIVVFITSGVMIQFILSEVNITWLTISISSIFMFVYYENITLYTDALTVLLNQRSYKAQLERGFEEETIVLLMDVNDFKNVNDRYGHNYGDLALKAIGNAIKEVYASYGYCYRIGGDEFCVFMKPKVDVRKLNKQFIAKLIELQTKDIKFPLVSIGSALYRPQNGLSILDTVEEADKNMYEEKRRLKAKDETR